MSFITRYPQKETATTVQAAAAAPTGPVNYAPPSHSSAKSRVQITSEAASRTIQHLVASQFQLAGFDSADKDAMEYLESLVVELISNLASLARNYAELGNRTMPHVKDLMIACEEHGVTIEDLRSAAKAGTRKKRKTVRGHVPSVVAPGAPPKPQDLLPSDDEDTGQEPEGGAKAPAPGYGPRSLASLPSHLPKLPPKHTYLRTDPPAPTTTSLASLQQKAADTDVIKNSLRNLIQATTQQSEADKEDLPTATHSIPPSLDGFVNWEGASGLRKPLRRWKI